MGRSKAPGGRTADSRWQDGGRWRDEKTSQDGSSSGGAWDKWLDRRDDGLKRSNGLENDGKGKDGKGKDGKGKDGKGKGAPKAWTLEKLEARMVGSSDAIDKDPAAAPSTSVDDSDEDEEDLAGSSSAPATSSAAGGGGKGGAKGSKTPLSTLTSRPNFGIVVYSLETIHDAEQSSLEGNDTWKMHSQIIEFNAVDLCSGAQLHVRCRPGFSWDHVRSPSARLYAEEHGHDRIVQDHSLPTFKESWAREVMPFLQVAAGPGINSLVMIAHDGDNFNHHILDKELRRLCLLEASTLGLQNFDPVRTLKKFLGEEFRSSFGLTIDELHARYVPSSASTAESDCLRLLEVMTHWVALSAFMATEIAVALADVDQVEEVCGSLLHVLKTSSRRVLRHEPALALPPGQAGSGHTKLCSNATEFVPQTAAGQTTTLRPEAQPWIHPSRTPLRTEAEPWPQQAIPSDAHGVAEQAIEAANRALQAMWPQQSMAAQQGMGSAQGTPPLGPAFSPLLGGHSPNQGQAKLGAQHGHASHWMQAADGRSQSEAGSRPQGQTYQANNLLRDLYGGAALGAVGALPGGAHALGLPLSRPRMPPPARAAPSDYAAMSQIPTSPAMPPMLPTDPAPAMRHGSLASMLSQNMAAGSCMPQGSPLLLAAGAPVLSVGSPVSKLLPPVQNPPQSGNLMSPTLANMAFASHAAMRNQHRPQERLNVLELSAPPVDRFNTLELTSAPAPSSMQFQ